MRASFLVILLVLAATVCGKIVKAHFIMEVPSLKYKIDGYGYVEINEFTRRISVLAPVHATFNGTLTDGAGSSYSTEGTVTVDDPPLSHLNDIKAAGNFDSKPSKTDFNGIMKVSVWDILKPKIPFEGHLKFSNGKEGDVKGIVDRPTL